MGLAERRLLKHAESVTRKAARQRRLDLERELADYDSDTERCDFEAMLDRFPDGVTYELREILSRQQRVREAARRARAFLAVEMWPRSDSGRAG